jgi:hypothetical protein
MKMERTECSETLAFKLQTPGNNPKENIRRSKHDESLKSRNLYMLTNEHKESRGTQNSKQRAGQTCVGLTAFQVIYFSIPVFILAQAGKRTYAKSTVQRLTFYSGS